jgi:hypothetical protein
VKLLQKAIMGVALSFSLLAFAQTDARLPAAVRGFRGEVRGTVIAVEDEDRFTLKVNHVVHVLAGNTARDAGSLAGITVRVGPRTLKDAQGRTVPMASHLAFIRQLNPNVEVNLAIANEEGDAFIITELSPAQEAEASLVATKSEAVRQEAEHRRLMAEIEALRESVARLNDRISELEKRVPDREAPSKRVEEGR